MTREEGCTCGRGRCPRAAWGLANGECATGVAGWGREGSQDGMRNLKSHRALTRRLVGQVQDLIERRERATLSYHCVVTEGLAPSRDAA
jgi:hypothetical protein